MFDRKEYNKQYRENNKEKIKQQNKQYRENNKEKIKQQNKHYDQSENGKKSNLIKRWKQRGLKEYGYTYGEVYEYYLSVTNCEIKQCNVKLNTNTKTKKCMDHCHQTGCFRWVLCKNCNDYDNWINKI